MVQRIIKLIKKWRKTDIEYYRSLGVTIGDDCRIYTDRFGSEPWLISIGNSVTITSGVNIITHDGATWLCRDDHGRRYLYRKVNIGNNVFIGINSIILPGVNIEDDVIIAAGSVVAKSIPKGSIVGGNPARIIGDFYKYKEKALTDFVSKKDMDFSKDYKDRISRIVDKTQKPNMKLIK
jgi:acetyltransferase-like isoleucine patch superfamily enzyme